MKDVEVIVEQAKELGHAVEVFSLIKSGKEASVFHALLDGEPVAMKMYKHPDERNFQNTSAYLAGKFYKRPSDRRAINKKNAFGKRLQQDNWIKREFFLLQKFYDAGASIPKPILQIGGAIFMELLGDQQRVASRLIDVELSEKEAAAAFESVIKSIEIFWKLGVVHADLSAYNILWWHNKPYVIDFPQAIDTRTNPDARGILERDLKNVVKYFSRSISIDHEQVKKRFRFV